MSERWFRRWMGFSYIPIKWQGWLVVTAMMLAFLPMAVLFFMLADRNPVASWLCAGLAATSALIGHAIVVWKLDPNGS